MRGFVKKTCLDRGFGFLRGDDGSDLFFHCSALVNLAFDESLEQTEVLFDETTDQRTGRPRAENVRAAT